MAAQWCTAGENAVGLRCRDDFGAFADEHRHDSASLEVIVRNQRPVFLLLLTLRCTSLSHWALVCGRRAARRSCPKLDLPLGLLASVVFLFFLMWETRLLRKQAFNAICGRGAVYLSRWKSEPNRIKVFNFDHTRAARQR